MATYQCPKGHTSTDPDYCSECGAPIGASTISHTTPTTSASVPGHEICPDCGTPRALGARFCEVCRYDFEKSSPSGQIGATSPALVPSATASALPTTVPPEPIKPVEQANDPASVSGEASPVADVPADAMDSVTGSAPLSTSASRWNVIVITDPSLAEDEETRKQCPQNTPDLVFPLDLDENLVGRRSDNRKIFPEIDVDDPGVSHRQLKLLRQPDGSFAALELGSANGTTLNGITLKPGLVTPLTAGDELIIGLWTRLRMRPR